jgi:hypothetical protein
VDKLKPLGQVYDGNRGTFNIGSIPNLHSLIPYSLDALKARFPVFEFGRDLVSPHRARPKEHGAVPVNCKGC